MKLNSHAADGTTDHSSDLLGTQLLPRTERQQLTISLAQCRQGCSDGFRGRTGVHDVGMGLEKP